MTQFKKGDRVRALEGARAADPNESRVPSPGDVVKVTISRLDSDGDVRLSGSSGQFLWCLPQYLEHVDEPQPDAPTIAPYEGKDGQWYWRLVAGNGQVVATGAEGYVSESNARRGARRAQELMAEAVVS